MSGLRPKALRRAAILLVSAFLPLCLPSADGQQSQQLRKPDSAPSSGRLADPLLQAMREELDRSKANLKMDNVPAPYYIEYRLSDVSEYNAEAAFGSLRQDQSFHGRSVRVVVRVGNYKQDSYYGPGIGAATFAPLDDDPLALRWQLWIATDQAFKAASQALAMKQAALSQFTADQPFDDFAKAAPLESVGPLAKLDFDAKVWKDALERSTALFRTDPLLQYLSASVRFRAVNQYYVNTEGTMTRGGYAVYFLNATGTTQASDGMALERSPYYASGNLKNLPAPDQFEADVAKVIETLKKLREAPLVEEDYRGPVLFGPDAASDLFFEMVGQNVLGIRPKPGESARTTGDYSSNYKGRVLPAFLSVIDDPTMKTFEGKQLIGSYDVDDEGVPAVPVPVIENGSLVSYLLGRQPIRDFPESNGHGRAGPGQSPAPSIGNLIVQSKQTLSPDDLRKKLIEMCKQNNQPFGFYVETLAGSVPRLLYRIYQDGHQELVRGASFDELDTRTLRNDLVAVGNDPLVSNRQGAVPASVVSPSALFDELEVKRTDQQNAKLPQYPPPDLSPAR
jgi:predicted Zn-dependent protease